VSDHSPLLIAMASVTSGSCATVEGNDCNTASAALSGAYSRNWEEISRGGRTTVSGSASTVGGYAVQIRRWVPKI
jgi:hypothetical protein